MEETKDFCNKCGMCCRAIMLNKSKEQVKEINSRGANVDAQFIIDNWSEISFEDLETTNPYLHGRLYKEMIDNRARNVIEFPDELKDATANEKMKYHFQVHGRKTGYLLYLYRCAKLDKEKNECMVYETRPNVCSGYPLYGRDLLEDDHIFYDDACGYKELLEIQKAEALQREDEMKRLSPSILKGKP